MKKSILIISILSILLFSGCNKTISLNNCISDIKEKVVKEFKSASKSSSEKLNKKIATINKAIADKDEEIIYDLMADDLKEHGDKLRIQLKEFVNYVPGEIVDTSNRDWGTLKHTEKYKKRQIMPSKEKFGIMMMKAITIAVFWYTDYLITQKMIRA